MAKKDLYSYYKSMIPNVIIGLFTFIVSILAKEKFLFILSILWLLAPVVFWYISKEIKEKDAKEEIDDNDKEYLLKLGEKTWRFFKESLIEENNYLPPDNYQVDRKDIFVDRTSSTNIGLGFLSVISSYDLKYENLEDTLILLDKMIKTVEKLQMWNGHLYNWYNIKTLEPLHPRYISTVDSGNFVGYVYVLKQFYKNIKEQIENDQIELDLTKKEELLNLIPKWVELQIDQIPFANADFSKLYDKEKGVFSIGFNIEEKKLTDSYYDLLASEERQASLIAISKKDVKPKH